MSVEDPILLLSSPLSQGSFISVWGTVGRDGVEFKSGPGLGVGREGSLPLCRSSGRVLLWAWPAGGPLHG